MKACFDYLQTVRNLRTRRAALKGMARLALAGLGSAVVPSLIPRVAFGAAGSARDIIVCVFLRGGADGLSFVAPYGDEFYYDSRPTLAIPEPGSKKATKGLALDSYFALHPSLGGLKELYDAGSLAVVQATGSTDPTRSHFDAMRFMEQATPGSKALASGWLGRHLQDRALQQSSPLRAVGFGGQVQTSLRGGVGVSPIAIDDLDDFGLNVEDDQAMAMQATLEKLYGTSNPKDILGVQAQLAFSTINYLGQISFSDYQPSNGAAYPKDSYFARGLAQTALLIKSDLGLEVACVDLDGWDTHETAGTNDGYLRDHIKEFGDSIAAFVRDLGDRMANVTIVTMSEFGRRVEENASRGLDHGHGNVMFVVGGGVNGRHVYGGMVNEPTERRWPTLAPEALDDGDLAIKIDQRAIFWELLNKRAGATRFAELFPGYNGGVVPVALDLFKS